MLITRSEISEHLERAEKELSETKARYEALLENDESGIWDDAMIYDFLSKEMDAIGIDVKRMTFEYCKFGDGKARYRVSADGKTIYIMFDTEDDAKNCRDWLAYRSDDDYEIRITKERPKTVDVTFAENIM